MVEGWMASSFNTNSWFSFLLFMMIHDNSSQASPSERANRSGATCLSVLLASGLEAERSTELPATSDGQRGLAELQGRRRNRYTSTTRTTTAPTTVPPITSNQGIGGGVVVVVVE